MQAFAFAIICIAISAAAASWNGGVALVAPSAHGGAVAGHGAHAPAAVIAGPSGTVSAVAHGGWNGLGWAGGYGLAGHGAWGGAWNGAHGAWNGAHGAWNGAWNGAHGAWNGAYGAWNGDHGAWAGSGHEGQWIPDANEKHYDDGSYRAEHHHGW